MSSQQCCRGKAGVGNFLSHAQATGEKIRARSCNAGMGEGAGFGRIALHEHGSTPAIWMQEEVPQEADTNNRTRDINRGLLAGHRNALALSRWERHTKRHYLSPCGNNSTLKYWIIIYHPKNKLLF